MSANKFLTAILVVAFAATAISAKARATEQPLPVLTVTVFAAPSQSVWIPTLIKKAGFDIKNGFRLEVIEKPSQVAYADFATGVDPVCYCASTAAVARFLQQGADITLLWNIFTYDYFIISSDPTIRSAKDLEGKTLLADTVTGSWAIASWFLQQEGVDFSEVQLRSAGIRGAAGLAELTTGRVDAVLVTPIDASAVLSASAGSLTAFSVYDADIWRKYARSPGIPSIALGAWRNWVAVPANTELLRKFYAANLDAVALVRSDPDKATDLIVQGTAITREALTHNLKNFSRLIDIRPISEYKESIAVLTQKLLPEGKQLDRPLTQAELDAYVSNFRPDE